MLSFDRVFSLGVNGALGCGVYSFLKNDLPVKSLYTQLGGVVASTLFQTYYPDFHTQLREKTGDNFTWAASWLYPGMIFVAGYLGGVPLDVNLYVTAGFAYVQHLSSGVTWSMADDRVLNEVKVLTDEAKKCVNQRRLAPAGEAIGQAEALGKKMVHQTTSWRLGEIDKGKDELSKAYLGLRNPKLEEAEKWARSIMDPRKKCHALLDIVTHYLECEKSEANRVKIEALLKECQAFESKPSQLLFLSRLHFAGKYDQADLLAELTRELEQLNPTVGSVRLLFALARGAVKMKDRDFAKHCLELGTSLLSKLENVTDKWFFFHSGKFDNPQTYQSIDAIHFYLSDVEAIKSYETLEGFKSAATYGLIRLARALGEWEMVTALEENGMLKDNHVIRVVMENAIALGKDALEEARANVQKAIERVEVYTLPADAEERDRLIGKYKKQAYRAIVLAQNNFDLEGAFETAKKMEEERGTMLIIVATQAQFQNLPHLAEGAIQELDRMLPSLSHRNRCFLLGIQGDSSTFERHREVWEAATPAERAQAMLALAKYHLKRNSPRQARALMLRAEALDTEKVHERTLKSLRNWNTPAWAWAKFW